MSAATASKFLLMPCIDNVGVASDVGTVFAGSDDVHGEGQDEMSCAARSRAAHDIRDRLPNELCLLRRRQLRGEIDIARQVGATLHLVGLPGYGVFEQQRREVR